MFLLSLTSIAVVVGGGSADAARTSHGLTVGSPAPLSANTTSQGVSLWSQLEAGRHSYSADVTRVAWRTNAPGSGVTIANLDGSELAELPPDSGGQSHEYVFGGWLSADWLLVFDGVYPNLWRLARAKADGSEIVPLGDYTAPGPRLVGTLPAGTLQSAAYLVGAPTCGTGGDGTFTYSRIDDTFPPITLSGCDAAVARGGSYFFVRATDGTLTVFDRNGIERDELMLPSAAGSISLSPDGATLAYLSSEDGTLHALDVSAATDTQLTTPGGYVAPPVWSPDGTMLAYEADAPTSDRSEIYVVEVATSETEQITSSLPDEFTTYPQWVAPDAVVFDVYDMGSPPDRIMAATIDGAESATITDAAYIVDAGFAATEYGYVVYQHQDEGLEIVSA